MDTLHIYPPDRVEAREKYRFMCTPAYLKIGLGMMGTMGLHVTLHPKRVWSTVVQPPPWLDSSLCTSATILDLFAMHSALCFLHLPLPSNIRESFAQHYIARYCVVPSCDATALYITFQRFSIFILCAAPYYML